LLDPDARERRDRLIAAARSAYLAEEFDAGDGAVVVMDSARAFGLAAGKREQEIVDTLDLTSRDADQRVKRAARGAEREEMLASLEELEAWYRDLVVCGAGAEASIANADRLADLRTDAEKVGRDAEDAAPHVRDAWRIAEELNVNPQLWLEALFVRLRRAFADRSVLRIRPAGLNLGGLGQARWWFLRLVSGAIDSGFSTGDTAGPGVSSDREEGWWVSGLAGRSPCFGGASRRGRGRHSRAGDGQRRARTGSIPHHLRRRRPPRLLPRRPLLQRSAAAKPTARTCSVAQPSASGVPHQPFTVAGTCSAAARRSGVNR
jgi:hypothetical protein